MMSDFEATLAAIIHSWGTPQESPFNVLEELHKDAQRLLAVAGYEFFHRNSS